VIIILFGPPGAGKGTQSQFLVNKLNFLQISTGDLLREEINKNTDIGKEISSLINKGDLVSDQLIYKILDIQINKIKKNKNIIFDGYPRNLIQAKNLEKLVKKYHLKIDKILFLNVKREEIQNRVSSRVVCKKCNAVFNLNNKDNEYNNHVCGEEFLIKRKDDNENTLLKRFDLYMKDTLPLIEFYKNHKGFFEIDGNMKITQINEQIRGFIDV